MIRDILLTNRHFLDVNPVSCGEEECESGHKFGPAQRNYFLVHYVFSGRGTFYTHGRDYSLSAGDIFLIRPGEWTVYEADEKEPWHYLWIGFDSSVSQGDWTRHDVRSILGNDVIFRDIKEKIENISEKELFLCGKIFELLSVLSRSDSPKRAATEEYVLQAQNYIETNYMNPIRVEELADSLNLNRSYFSTSFRKMVGSSPQKYLVDYRLQKASEILGARNISVREAALSCGYTDIYNFSKMFKKRFGISPANYRSKLPSS